MTVVFVFGSNLAGRHGAGSALHAAQVWGAKYGVGIGRTGNAYAIPTKDGDLKTLPLDFIQYYVKAFLKYAADRPAVVFRVAAIGCGLAGYTPEEIAPMFKGATMNVQLPKEFAPWVPSQTE